MKLEERLRAELDRSGRATRVGAAPSVDELATIAGQRQRRNRRVGSIGVAAVSGVLLVGAVIAAQPGDQQVVVADGGSDAAAVVADDVGTEMEATESLDATASSEQAGESSQADVVPSNTANETGDTAVADEVATAGSPNPLPEIETEAVVVPSDLDDLQRVLQGPGSPLNVSTRDSAVEFAGGSGVLLVPDGQGYRGLATSFADEGGRQIGLSSVNGLDWVEVELSGVPDGATATSLRSHDGGYVALFDRFDAEAGQKQMFVGTSADLAAWELSAPLAGFDVVATDLAVGPTGVMVIGDDFGPDIWFGPLGGPYELTGQLEASMLFGVTVVGNEFLVAGRSPDSGASIFSSEDGRTWSRGQLASPGDGELGVSVADGTIIVSTTINDSPATVLSSDGGVTWDLLGEGEVRSLSVNGSTLGFLGSPDGGPSVTLADGESFATADLDVAAPDRVSLLSTTATQAIMLVDNDGGGLTWVLATR